MKSVVFQENLNVVGCADSENIACCCCFERECWKVLSCFFLKKYKMLKFYLYTFKSNLAYVIPSYDFLPGLLIMLFFIVSSQHYFKSLHQKVRLVFSDSMNIFLK